MNITDWAKEDRPREKMMANGEASLSNAELLAILIRTGEANRTAVDIARDMLQSSGQSLAQLQEVLIHLQSDEQSRLLRGIGPAKSCTIRAAMELGRRLASELEQRGLNRQRITDSASLFALFKYQLSDLDHEQLWAVYTSKSGVVLHRELIGDGGVDSAPGDIRRICRPALQYMASNVLLCHNHPHSTLQASRADRELTRLAREALRLFEVRLLDHIIVADGRYYSLADNGDM